MLCRIVKENYLNEREMFQESVMAHSLKGLAFSGVEHHCHLGRSYDRRICVNGMGN